MTLPRKLFLDLDGVLADFDRGVSAVTGKRPDELSPRHMWAALARYPDFYATLELMADARELWEFCRPFAPTILTGLPRGNWAEDQKRRWVRNMLGADVPVITTMSRDKHKYAEPGAVLVDDRIGLRAAWEAAGGIFIHHVSAARSIAALEGLGFHRN
ncbi:MAG TPA: hypothetical protein VF342_06630 [Alphaproteobacteria bacterium]